MFTFHSSLIETQKPQNICSTLVVAFQLGLHRSSNSLVSAKESCVIMIIATWWGLQYGKLAEGMSAFTVLFKLNNQL
jgi:hypothetical protein